MLTLQDQPMEMRFFLSFLLITLPSTLFRKLAYYLFAAPCLLTDKSKNSWLKNCCLSCCDGLAAGVGYLITCAWGITFLVVGIVLWATMADVEGVVLWAYGIGQIWVLWFLTAFLFMFNPSPTFSKLMAPWNCMVMCLSCGTAKNLKVGVWHEERAKVHKIIKEKIEERGDTMFFVPSVVNEEDIYDSGVEENVLDARQKNPVAFFVSF